MLCNKFSFYYIKVHTFFKIKFAESSKTTLLVLHLPTLLVRPPQSFFLIPHFIITIFLSYSQNNYKRMMQFYKNLVQYTYIGCNSFFFTLYTCM